MIGGLRLTFHRVLQMCGIGIIKDIEREIRGVELIEDLWMGVIGEVDVDEAGEEGVVEDQDEVVEDQDDLEIAIIQTIMHVIKQAIIPMAMDNRGMTCKQQGITCDTTLVVTIAAAAQVGITTGKRGGEGVEVAVAVDTGGDLTGRVDLEVMIHLIIVDEERSTNIGTRIVQGGKEVEVVIENVKGRSIRSTNMIENTVVVMMTNIIINTVIVVIDLDQGRN